MDYFQKLNKQVATFLGITQFVATALAIAGVLIAAYIYSLPLYVVALIGLVISSVAAYLTGRLASTYVTEPVLFLWKAILHVSPSSHGASAPDLDKSRVGRELVTSLALQVYQLASSETPTPQSARHTATAAHSRTDAIMQNFPLPVFVMDKKQNIVYANTAALHYIDQPKQDVINHNMYSVLDLSFPSDHTFDAWLTDSRDNKATASESWERVRLMLGDQKTKKQFDMAAYYNKDNPENAETIITFFDKTVRYNKDDDAVSFIALAVHELRTPLTVLRGYIEVFEEELEGKLDPELEGFMHKMQASAQQLTAFVSNILNVARVEENQLFLQLHEENWEKILRSILNDMALRAQVHDKTIEFSIQPDLPTVALDRVSIYEVVGNLIDNAIKYSDKSSQIIVKSYLRDDGMVETTVQDFGIGVPSSIIGNLFEKFYRNHRSRAQVGGTGLGLYLSKAIVNAHGGQIWVQSKEGEGSTFGFTLVPYAQLADELKTTDNKDIRRTAHGWIKNHSFYQR